MLQNWQHLKLSTSQNIWLVIKCFKFVQNKIIQLSKNYIGLKKNCLSTVNCSYAKKYIVHSNLINALKHKGVPLLGV